MNVIRLTPEEVAEVIAQLQGFSYEVLVATDPVGKSFKIKIDGGIWSPPMGVPA